MLPDRTRVDGFVEFVETNEGRLRHALTAALGLEAGKDAAAEALAYGWEHWERVEAMANPVGYLYTVGRSTGRKLLSSKSPVFPLYPGGPDTLVRTWSTCRPRRAARKRTNRGLVAPRIRMAHERSGRHLGSVEEHGANSRRAGDAKAASQARSRAMSVDLDHQLRDYCRLMDETQGALSFEDILERTGDLQVIPGQGNEHPSSRRKWIAVAAASIAILVTAVGLRLLSATDDTPEPADQPTTTSITVPTTLAPNVDSIPPLEVRGWPDTNENAAGLYSWDWSRCARSFCNFGWMHNGYGSGDVDILVWETGDSRDFFDDVPVAPVTDEGATAVTVAGHDGIHRRVDASREEWIVDIEGTTIVIRLKAEPGTSQADLAEAHAIIDSMRTEPVDNRFGFRLVFTLSTDDWDSG